MTTIYLLRTDTKKIAEIQSVTQSTSDYGIEPTHGVFGSDEWWSNIDSGELPRVTVRGIITRISSTEHGGWPEFELTTTEGEASNWTREVNNPELDKLYRAEAKIEVDYVIQRNRKSSFDGGSETKIVIEIRIDDAVQQKDGADGTKDL